jgi:chaperonin GroES
MASYIPKSDYVLVRPEEKKETRTETGLYIPETADQGKPQSGIAVEVGKGRYTEAGEFIPMDIEKGQRVLFGMYAGIPLEIGKTKYLVIRQEDILLVEVEDDHVEDEVG